MALFDPDVCHTKRTYEHTLDANRAILLRYRTGAPQLEHYQCPVCGYLHLTRKRPA